MSPWTKLKRAFAKPVVLIDEALWRDATRDYAFMEGLSDEESRRLRYIASDFLSRKTFVGAADLVVTERMKIEVAAQACILVLGLNVDYYDGWQEIIIYPSRFMPEREVVDAAGVVHRTRQVLSGEAWLGGPVVLSYEDVVREGNDHAGLNVVIHEFAHKIDMLTGEANGSPPLHKGMNRETWKRTFMQAYLAFCKSVDHASARAMHDGGAALDAIPIDPYGAETPAEFFAVVSEAFFEMPDAVMALSPTVYAQLKLLYKQDPFARMTSAAEIETLARAG